MSNKIGICKLYWPLACIFLKIGMDYYIECSIYSSEKNYSQIKEYIQNQFIVAILAPIVIFCDNRDLSDEIKYDIY